MSSLPWICVVTLALFCCLPAKPVPSGEIIYAIDFLKNGKCEDPDATFYTPVNVQENCLFGALDCYKKELDVLVGECQLKSDYADEALNLQTLLNVAESGPSCLTCESFPEMKFKDFFENMKDLVQQIESQRNGR